MAAMLLPFRVQPEKNSMRNDVSGVLWRPPLML
jgi:hypothetical protein